MKPADDAEDRHVSGESPSRFGAEYYTNVYSPKAAGPMDPSWWANRYYARLVTRLLRRARGRRVLDVGCGQGLTLARLGPRVEAWGIEVSDYAISRCKQIAPAARVLQGDIEEGVPAGLPEDGFDVVLARYILEHLRRPGPAVQRCASLVRPGGFFLYAVPNMQSPGLRLKGDRWFGYGDETHHSLLQPREWLDLTEAAGFETVKVFTDGFWDVPYVRWIPTILQYGIFSAPTILEVIFVSTLLPMPWGENLIVIARRR